ncbi:THAP domain-containing protein 2-like isoform X2 [Tachypleus tridentatus]|uniref:THAP domain-containing protein 2-like isoform X2 n=1 Tax=Tachypleus tridentatus TaxID=6853 RepID=UPI003FD4A230
MVHSCCAFNCSNRRGQAENVSYYRFPKDPDRRRRWIAAVNRKTGHPQSTSDFVVNILCQGRRVMIPYHLTMYLPYFILHVLP